MDDKSLYEQILGITRPWSVEKVDLQLEQGEIHVWVTLPANTLWVCPECLEQAPIHDHQERSWRHLDTCQYRTIVSARVPRLKCPTHGVKQLRVPWAEAGSRYTALFEALVIDWLKHASVQAVAKRMKLTWDQTAGIMERAVRRGLARRQTETVTHIGVDEISFQRRHQYVTVVNDLKGERVLFVADDRKRESLDQFWRSLSWAQRSEVVAVAMDMWEPYISSTWEHVPKAGEKIVFDKFHIATNLGEAVDLVRRTEHRQLRARGHHWLTGTKFDWLRHPNSFSLEGWRAFLKLTRERDLKTARAWAMKENFMTVFDYHYVGVADKHFMAWFRWARRSHLQPMKKIALTLKRHWQNIRTYFTHRITNSRSETTNSLIHRVKVMARGFRNRDRFRQAILFHCGKLDLYPALPGKVL
jgi:transposase